VHQFCELDVIRLKQAFGRVVHSSGFRRWSRMDLSDALQWKRIGIKSAQQSLPACFRCPRETFERDWASRLASHLAREKG